MDNQAYARNTDPTTAKQAARTVRVTHLESIVLNAVKLFPMGAIMDDIIEALPNHEVRSITPRFRPLINKELLVLTGESRKGKAGRQQQVMKASELTFHIES